MRHHYIPCFYTKRWVGEDRRLCEYSRPHKSVKTRRTAPAGTGYEEDLYAIPRAYGDKRHLLETRFMKNIDQKASDALSKMETAGINALNATDRVFWATFIISIMHRSPEKLKELSVNADVVQRKIMSNLRASYPERRSADDPYTFDEFVQIADDGGYLERNKALLLQNTIILPQSVRLISEFHWGICIIDAYQHELLTSDRPIVMSNGLGKDDGHIAFPTGPKRLFLAARTPDVTIKILMRRDLVDATNNLIVRQAQRYVYGRNGAQLRFVERRLHI